MRDIYHWLFANRAADVMDMMEAKGHTEDQIREVVTSMSEEFEIALDEEHDGD
jgi:hypothetical protein